MTWKYIYGVIHYFVEGGQNGNFHLRGKNDFRKMAASLLYFYIEIGRSISKSVDFSKKIYFSKVCMAVTQSVLQIS